VSEVLGTDAYDALLPEIEKVLSGETVTFVREGPYRTGERYIHVNYIPQLGPRGEVIGFHSFVWDISAMKAAEKALRRSGLEMEERVVERTRELELANRERINILHQLVSAQEDERGRMARDVHDQLGQQMTVLRLKLERLENISNGRPDQLREIHDIREFALQLDADVDFLAWRFRPAVLDDIGIVAALDQYVTRWSNHSHVAAKFTSRPLRKDRMDGDTETNYYRIVQEALNNISKHANASVVDVILVPRESGTVLIIEDNGIGFDPDEQRRDGGGMGLLGMSERAALIGGKLEIESAKGRGTTIFVTVPGPARIENGNE
jgi:signal transduction histidine kinase